MLQQHSAPPSCRLSRGPGTLSALPTLEGAWRRGPRVVPTGRCPMSQERGAPPLLPGHVGGLARGPSSPGGAIKQRTPEQDVGQGSPRSLSGGQGAEPPDWARASLGRPARQEPGDVPEPESMQPGSRPRSGRPSGGLACGADRAAAGWALREKRKVLLGGYVSFVSRELGLVEVRTFQNLPLLIQAEEAFCDI